jgi:hypothetical protein
VVDRPVITTPLSMLQSAVVALRSGECVGCALPLTGPPLHRLWCYLTLPIRRRRAERVFADSGADVVGRWGVDPNIESPSCVFDLDSSADIYAGARLRPRGSKIALRRALAMVFGCDPALGAIVIVGRKR